MLPKTKTPEPPLGELAPSLRHAERHTADYDQPRPDVIETPGLPELAAAVLDPNAQQVLYRVTYERVGRRGGRNGTPPPQPLEVWAMSPDQLAEKVHDDARKYLASRDIEVCIDLEINRGIIFAGMNSGGAFTVEVLATDTTATGPRA